MFGGFQLRAECPKLPSCRCCREAASREPCSTDVWEKLFQIWRQRTRTSPKIGPRKCANKTLNSNKHSVTLGDTRWHSVTLGDTRWHSVTLSYTKRDKILESWVTQMINIKMVLRDASASKKYMCRMKELNVHVEDYRISSTIECPQSLWYGYQTTVRY